MFGWLGPWDHKDDTHELPTVLHGHIGSTPVTLLNLVPGGRKATGIDPPYETTIAINTVLAGLHLAETTRFTRASVRLLHLNEWANRSPWDFPTSDEVNRQEVVVWTDPGQLTAQLPEAIATLCRGLTQVIDDLSSAAMTSDEAVHFDFQSPLDLEAVEHDYIRPLRSLVELAAARRSAVIELIVFPEEYDDFNPGATVLSATSRREVPSPQPWFQFLFTLQDIGFSTVMPAWWELQSQIGVVVDLVASLRDGGSVGNVFLNAASAIEGYHRCRYPTPKASPEHKALINRLAECAGTAEEGKWIKEKLAYSHEPSFAQRVDDVVARAGPLFPAVVGSLARWRRWVKEGRNSVAHRDPAMVDIEKEWRTAVRVAVTIQWLMTLVFLRDLGIADSMIEAGVQREGSLKVAQNHLRQVRPDWFI